MKHLKKFNESKDSKKEIRLEKRDNKTYAFVEITDGDSKNGKDVTISPEKREEIEKILNK